MIKYINELEIKNNNNYQKIHAYISFSPNGIFQLAIFIASSSLLRKKGKNSQF